VHAGRIGIIDHDVVELSNLQRQTLHTESRLGMPKAESAACALKQFRRITHTRSPFFPLFYIFYFSHSVRRAHDYRLCLRTQDQFAPSRRRDNGCTDADERARAAGQILRRDPGLHRQPCNAVPDLRHGRPPRQAARERRRAEIRRPALHV
jgi:ThiF family